MTTLGDVSAAAQSYATGLLDTQKAAYDTALLTKQSELEVTQAKLDAARARIAELEGALAPAPTPTPAPAPARRLKPHLAGLLNRQGIPAGKPFRDLGGFVVQDTWGHANPKPGAFDWSVIDESVAWIRANAPWMGVKLRFGAGIWAPAWAKALGGTPIPYAMHQPNAPASPSGASTGRWWSAPGTPYANAWEAFLVALCARYDPVPEVRSINVAMVHMESSEMCLIFGNDSDWAGAGYKEADRQAALLREVDVLTSKAPTTHVDFAFHGLHTIGAGSRFNNGWAGTYQLAAALYEAHSGEQLTAFHTGFGDKTAPGGVLSASGHQAYDTWLTRRYPFDLQTESINNGFSTPEPILRKAVGMGVTSVELPSGWGPWASQPWFAEVNKQLAVNAAARDKGA